MLTPSQQPDLPLPSTYGLNYDGTITTQFIAVRQAASAAAFFLPCLQPGMRVLDCGCGPGSITVGLAQAVAPGEVVGIDLGASQTAQARASARNQGVANVRFVLADMYALPFPANTFDAIFGHAVLGHLTRPRHAVQEMYRVVKPGGIVGLRNPDWGSVVMSPTNDALEAFWDLRRRVQLHTGRDPGMGRKLKQVLREAGFTNTSGGASCEAFGTREQTQHYAQARASLLDDIHATAIAMDAAHAAVIAKARVALQAWSEHPDAMVGIMWFDAVGYKA